MTNSPRGTVHRCTRFCGGCILGKNDFIFPYGSKRLPPLFDIPTGWDPNTKKEPTGLFFAACRRPCFFDSSYGLQVAATPVDIPTGWDPRANQSPTGALVTVLCTAALFNSRTGQIKTALARTATPVDVPTGWDPNTKKEPIGLFFAACRRPCSFDSSYGLHDAATTVDVPTGWDPRANQSPTGALVTVLCTAALFDSRTGQIKNALARMRKGVFMTRTGIEPMLQP